MDAFLVRPYTAPLQSLGTDGFPASNGATGIIYITARYKMIGDSTKGND
jgi:hypothetical protein